MPTFPEWTKQWAEAELDRLRLAVNRNLEPGEDRATGRWWSLYYGKVYGYCEYCNRDSEEPRDITKLRAIEALVKEAEGIIERLESREGLPEGVMIWSAQELEAAGQLRLVPA